VPHAEPLGDARDGHPSGVQSQSLLDLRGCHFGLRISRILRDPAPRIGHFRSSSAPRRSLQGLPQPSGKGI
jgi:hypothetical protein